MAELSTTEPHDLQVMFRRYDDDTGAASLVPLNRPNSKAELEDWIRTRRPLYMGESGLGIEHLPKYVRGRVIGIYKGPERVPATSQLTFRD